MSLVIVIIGMIILIVFPALQAVQQSTQVSLTNSNLNALMRASSAFTHAHGCLPCPTPAAKFGNGFGRVRGDAGNTMCGDCNMAEGIPPFASLGIPPSAAKDGWGRWITMRVDPELTKAFGVVPPTAPCTASDPLPCVLDASQRGLCAANIPNTNRIKVSIPAVTDPQEAAILFLSHGKNGFGAFRAGAINQGQKNAHVYRGPANGVFEKNNADFNYGVVDDGHFTDAPRSEDPPFDDILLYLGRNALVALIGNGVCETAW